MTSKERRQFILYLLNYQTIRTKHFLRMYFGIDSLKRNSLEEVGHDFECSTRLVRYHMNKGLRMLRVFVINGDKVFQSEGMEEEREKCKQLKEYVEGINPDLIHKEPPYHYSKFLDEFMLCLIDGKEG